MEKIFDIPDSSAPPDPLALERKIAIVLDPKLPRGATDNRAAVLATGLAARHPEILGPDLSTADGETIPGFTKVPIVVLAGRLDQPLGELVARARAAECTVLVFLARAQGMRSYEAYRESVAQSCYNELDVDAVVIFGEKKKVNRLVGSLPALR